MEEKQATEQKAEIESLLMRLRLAALDGMPRAIGKMAEIMLQLRAIEFASEDNRELARAGVRSVGGRIRGL
jgi:hypothetical protein